MKISKGIKYVFAITWLLFCCVYIFWKGIFPGWSGERSDFSNYYASAALLVEGEQIADFYNNDWFLEKANTVGERQGAKFSPFPPVTSFLFVPATAFSPITAKRIWLAVNMVLLFLMGLKAKSLTEKNWLFSALMLSLFFMPIASNFRLGQTYLLFTLFIFTFLDGKNQKVGPVLLGFAGALKYLPLLFLVNVSSNNWRSIFIWCGGSVLVLVALPIFLQGFAPYQAFMAELLQHLNGNLSGQGQFSYTFQSLDTLLANLFTFNERFNPNPVIQLANMKLIVKSVFSVVVILVSAKAYLSGRLKAKKLSVAVVVLGGMVLIPASASYHLLFLIPVIFMIINNIKRKRDLAVICLLTFLTCNIQSHYVPHFQSRLIDVLAHFPRFYGLFGLLVYTLILQRRQLRAYG